VRIQIPDRSGTFVREGAGVEDADAPETRPDTLTSDTNRTFGRQYRILAFRWLTEEEL